MSFQPLFSPGYLNPEVKNSSLFPVPVLCCTAEQGWFHGFPWMDEVCGVPAAAGQSLHLLVAQPHGSRALPAGLVPKQEPKLAQQAEGSFGVWGVPARLSPSSHGFIHNHLRASLGCQAREAASVWVLSPKPTDFCLHPEEG